MEQHNTAMLLLLFNQVNGLLAWAVTHSLYLIFSLVFPVFSGSVIADNWGSLLIAANIYGYGLAIFSYLKAHYFPTHPEDRKFSSSALYDFYMGIEFNPRFGEWFDFKLFHNGRPGIIAWTLISYSFAAQQYLKYGTVTNSIVLVNFLHAMYVLDFFWCEDWYLRTIGMCNQFM
jgi:7-dehydrocholesterol reductase